MCVCVRTKPVVHHLRLNLSSEHA